MKSRVHPTYKTKYRAKNWPSYDRALVGRGDVTVWLSPEALAAWKAARVGKRGGQWKYSDLAIETALALRLIFNLPRRQTEGFLNLLFGMMGLDLSAPDHTTPSRRGQNLDVRLHRVSIVGEGEWAAAKHGGKGKRGWRKLHLGVDRSGAIIAQVLTEGNADDARTGLALIDVVEGDIASFTGDAAYATVSIYDAAGARSAKVIVPPTKTATRPRRRRPRSIARDRTIRRVRNVGRRRCRKESGYHRQGTVENAFFRYKSIVGDRLRARHPRAQEAEALIACNVLNRMFEIGRPSSVAIGR